MRKVQSNKIVDFSAPVKGGWNASNDLYFQLLEASINSDIPIISFKHCCQLMAIVYVFGSDNENFVFNKKLYCDIMYSQKKLKIKGGNSIDFNTSEEIKKYIHEIVPNGYFNKREKTDYTIEFENKYNIKLNY